MNWVNEEDECKTALHQSILGVRFFLIMAVLLGINQQVAILCIVVSTTGVPKGGLLTAESLLNKTKTMNFICFTSQIVLSIVMFRRMQS